MSQVSNLYAEKIYSEHPSVLWPLDDQTDYITLISEANRNIVDEWTNSGGTFTQASTDIGQFFLSSYTTDILGDVPVNPTEDIIMISPNLINANELNQDIGTFNIATYFYSDSAFLRNLFIGYEYTDPSTSTVVQELKEFRNFLIEQWGFVSNTFEIPNVNAQLRLVIKIGIAEGGESNTDYHFALNGVTFGQWSENFAATSLGISTVALPSNIYGVTATEAVEAFAYGLGEDKGYYLVSDNFLVARNTSIPLVYGSSSLTKLTPNGLEPSIVFPGQGFLNKKGQFIDYTVEFWLRVKCNSSTPKRIFGPVSSDDGLYVDSGFLTFVLGNQFGSHYVGEWYRPMLIDIRVIRDSVSVLVNGEQVIEFGVTTSDLVLPDILDQLGNERDWLGFYAHDDVSPIEIDCFAIYPYNVSITLAKRRWVYGQGVISPEGIDASYNGTSAFIDYPFANYTTNYLYPDFARWEQGSFDNIATTPIALTPPNYSLPEVFTGTKTLQELYSDNQSAQIGEYKFITFRPNEDWDEEECYFNFPRFNILTDQIHTFYGVFSSEDLINEEILFKVYNTLTGNSFKIIKDADEIKYILGFNGIDTVLYTTDIIVSDEKFAVGVQISALSEYYGGNTAAFFGNQNGIEMYVAGDETGTNQFTGKIFAIGLCTSVNSASISDHFEANGTAILDSYLATGSEESANAIALLEHTASYMLLPTIKYNSYFLDIGASGYWEDYLPLSYFAQFVKNADGEDFYDLDFLQVNFSVTEDAPVKASLTFQYITEGANAPQSAFTITKTAAQNSVIDLSEDTTWAVTKYEINNNTLVYPRKDIDFNELAIVYRLDFNIRGIISQPVSLKRFEICSQVFNDNSFNPIGTRFGTELFPYKRAGLYYDYKTKNPFSIYKGSTPYLYLTEHTGIQGRGEYNNLINRGISFPVNRTLASNFRISAMQMWMRFEDDLFPVEPTEIFEIRYKEDTIKFYVVANSPERDRGRIYSIEVSTGEIFDGLVYYWNGNLTREPVMNVKEWGSLGLAFVNTMIFDLFLGAINLTSSMLFNNIAYYRATDLQQIQNSVNRRWVRVLTDGVLYFDWEYWANNFTWIGMLSTAGYEIYGINPTSVYNTYLGINKIVVDDNEGMLFDTDKIKIYSDVVWLSNVKTPV